VCALARQADKALRWQQRCDADYDDLIAVKDACTCWLVKTGILPVPFRYTCESTGPYHKPLIRAWGGEPSIVNPLLANPSRRKTDVLDAKLLAQHAMCGMWPRSYLPNDELENLRMLIKSREASKRRRLRASNRIVNIMTAWGYPVQMFGPVRSPACRGMIEDIARGHPPEIKGLPRVALPPRIGRMIITEYNLLDMHDYEERAALQWAIEDAKRAMLPGGPGGLLGEHLIAMLTTVPGIGQVTALTWICTVCDPARFASEKAVAAFAGCDPSLKVSAGKVTSYTRRGGNQQLHDSLVCSAMGLVNRAREPFGQWGARLAKKPGRGQYRRAVGAVARRLCVSLYHVHRLGEPFSYAGYRLSPPDPGLSGPFEPGELSTRLLNYLAAAGISTREALVAAFNETLYKSRGFGPAKYKEVRDWMDSGQRNRGSISGAQSSEGREGS